MSSPNDCMLHMKPAELYAQPRVFRNCW